MRQINISAADEEKQNIVIKYILFSYCSDVLILFPFSLLCTARHAQRTHLRQPANYPDWCLLPPTSRYGYVHQNIITTGSTPHINLLQSSSSSVALSAAEELSLSLIVLTALQDKIAHCWLICICRSVPAFICCLVLISLPGSVYTSVARLMETTGRRSATCQPGVLCDFFQAYCLFLPQKWEQVVHSSFF